MAHMTPAEVTPGDAPSRTRLAEAVKARRLELGLSARAAAEKADVARGTWIALEDGSRRTAENNHAGIERALHWTRGSIAAVLAGGSPSGRTAEETTRQPTSPDHQPVATANHVTNGISQDALITVMRSPDIDDRTKARIVQILIAEQKRFERERVERAEELIEAFRDDVP